jgi:hypothetical protein
MCERGAGEEGAKGRKSQTTQDRGKSRARARARERG